MGKYAKAIVAAATAGLGALGTALADNVVSPAEWVIVATAALGALTLTWAIPNKTANKSN